MNVIDEIVKELKEEDLLDQVEYVPFDRTRNSSIHHISQVKPLTYLDEAPSQPKSVPESSQKELRYSVSNINTTETQFSPQQRIRLIRKTSKFSRTCKCCSSDVFILDAYCPKCNERMVGKFVFYSFFVLCAFLIAFMIFYMAISNPY